MLCLVNLAVVNFSVLAAGNFEEAAGLRVVSLAANLKREMPHPELSGPAIPPLLCDEPEPPLPSLTRGATQF